MKVLLLMALLLLCSTQVLTLRCFTCDDGPDCRTETECSPSSLYCKTYAHGEELSRTCEDICDEDFFTSCCQHDLCSN